MEEKRSKSDKRSPKEDKKKKKDKDSTEGSPDTSKLTKEIASLKDKVKQARRAQKDVEPNEYFEKNPSKFDKGTKPAEKVRLTRGHTGRVEAVSWANSDPDYVLTAGQDGKMLVWHAPSGNKVQMFKLKSAWVQACAFRSLGGTNGVVASGGMDNIVTLFSLQDNTKPMKELTTHTGFISACKFLADKDLLTASSDHTCILWDAQQGKEQTTFNFDVGATSLATNKKGDSFLTGLTNGTVTLCDPKSGKQVSDFEAHNDSVCSVSFFPNDTAFATASDDLTCHLYDIRSADNCLLSFEAPKKATEITSIVFSHSGRFLFAAYDDAIRVWDSAEGKVLYELPVPAKTSAIDINCDGSALCSVSHDNEGRVWTI